MAAADGFDVVVIGAGAVGLACAASLARAGHSVLIVERHGGIARETTSRNSEVVHAGIYYPAGSLKAVLCCEGRELLYERCEARRIPHRRIGKLIVATSAAEEAMLDELQARAETNGVPDLERIDAATARALEPRVSCDGALHSRATGIVDGHALSLSYQAEAEEHGATLLLRAEVSELHCEDAATRSARWRVVVSSAAGVEAIHCAAVVNAAGLAADRIAELAGLDVAACGYRLHPCKGDYLTLAPGAPLRLDRLVYPVPSGAGLGIHATLDLAGRIRFGPDAEYVDAPEYGVDPMKAEVFASAIQRYLPDVRSDWLLPDYAGVRPKLAGPGESFRDFVVHEESGAGLPGLVNCIGIESPGLTAAGAIAERVRDLLTSL